MIVVIQVELSGLLYKAQTSWCWFLQMGSIVNFCMIYHIEHSFPGRLILYTFFKVVKFQQIDQRLCSQMISVLNVALKWSLIYIPLGTNVPTVQRWSCILIILFSLTTILTWFWFRFYCWLEILNSFPYTCPFILLLRNVYIDPLPILLKIRLTFSILFCAWNLYTFNLMFRLSLHQAVCLTVHQHLRLMPSLLVLAACGLRVSFMKSLPQPMLWSFSCFLFVLFHFVCMFEGFIVSDLICLYAFWVHLLMWYVNPFSFSFMLISIFLNITYRRDTCV